MNHLIALRNLADTLTKEEAKLFWVLLDEYLEKRQTYFKEYNQILGKFERMMWQAFDLYPITSKMISDLSLIDEKLIICLGKILKNLNLQFFTRAIEPEAIEKSGIRKKVYDSIYSRSDGVDAFKEIIQKLWWYDGRSLINFMHCILYDAENNKLSPDEEFEYIELKNKFYSACAGLNLEAFDKEKHEIGSEEEEE